MKPMRSLTYFILLLSSTQLVSAGGLLGSLPHSPENKQGIVAQGMGGTLTHDAMDAYIEALEFCLTQVGSPTSFSAQDRQAITQQFASGFSGLPVDTQQALVAARNTWNQYQAAWTGLSLNDKKEFAYSVLALAYGDQAAAQALGMNQQHSYSGFSSGSSSFSEPCYQCTEQGSMIYGGGVDIGGGEIAY